MTGGAVSAWLSGAARRRALLVALLTCAAALALAGIPGGSGAWLLSSLFILAEFTGGWIAVAIASMLLGAAAFVVTSPVYPLMFTVAGALLCARGLRAGLPPAAAALLLAAGALAARSLGGELRGAWAADSVARALLEACCGVALVILCLVARPPRAWCIPPMRRWRFEDVLFLVVVAAFVPLGLVTRAPGAMNWFAVTVMLVVLTGITGAGLAGWRVTRGLRVLLEKGRVRGVRRRSSRLPREMATLFLAAREVSDDLHRRTALQELQIESARLRAGRLQQQVESHDRERRRMELALHQAAGAGDAIERRWRAFLDAIPEALFITDASGRIEYANEGVRQVLGYDPRVLAGTRVTELIPAALLPSGQAGEDVLGLAATSASAEPMISAERPVRVRDAQGGLRALAARVRQFQTSQGARLGIRLREASGPSQRARDQFVATLSHEIRTPLHGLMATLDLLRSEALSSAGAKRLGIARTSAKTLIRIANDILDLSRISAGGMAIERKAMSIERLVNDVVDEGRAREEALSLDVLAAIGDSVPPAVLGDPLRIKQVLRNLLSNALKFTPAGRVTVSASWANGICAIDVSDTGAGIPADRRDSIFEAFVQADGARSRRQGGAGLGLAIGRQLSEAMGGSLALLQSGPRGSTFRLLLPLPATDEAPPDEQSQRNLQSVKGRILVAEDDDASRYVAQALLESLGCPARIVSNGAEALDLMRSGEFDLALLDCEMPGLDGYEVTTRFRGLIANTGGRRIPIIAMTASTMSADRQRCFDAGMDDMLAKPFGRSALNDILVKWLGPPVSANGQAPLARDLAMRPELDTEVFDELRQSLNWQLPPLRKIYASISESARKTMAALGSGTPADVELATRRLHSLQGGAALVGARQIEYLATRLTQALKQQRSAELIEGTPLLPDALARFEKVLDERLESVSGR